jgi:hypothetical protein
MPLFAWWLMFATLAVVMIVGAKALDERDRRRFSRRHRDAPDTASGEPSIGQHSAERISLGPEAPDSCEIGGQGPGVS